MLNRRQFLRRGGAAGVGASASLLLPAVARADHLAEPTRSNWSLDTILIYPYQAGPAAAIPQGGVIDFRAVRIEPKMNVGRHNEGPTEHWRFDLAWFGIDPEDHRSQRGIPVLLWGGFWGHQNSAATFQLFEAAQFTHNAQRAQNGPGRVEVEATGQESGRVETMTWPFTVAIP